MVGCPSEDPGDAPDGPPPFVFEVWLSQVSEEIISVDDQAVTVSQTSTDYVATVAYEDYATAIQTPAITFTIRRADDTMTVSMARPGACARQCTLSDCPTVEEVTLERIYMGPPFEFAPLDSSCLVCTGGTKHVVACQ